jgi:ribonucleoside-diphosphate reductase alpha subunit
VDQGGGKRKGAFAVYLECHHPDIFDILQLKKNTGPEELRARDMFYSLWIPNLFMKRVEYNGKWTLFCPDACPKLHQTYGKEFEQLYEQYEQEGKGVKTINAQELWFAILESQIETGTPYMLYKDACNLKSNQQNLGTIMGSNLCTEVVQYTSKDEIAVCNLASVSLKEFIIIFKGEPFFDHISLGGVIRQMVRNLNQVININYYPLPEAEYSNKKHRPIGLGVQGLAETFFLMRYPYESEEAKELNRTIFETIYYYACLESCELAKEHGYYESFPGSPASKGLLQFDLWSKDINHKYSWTTLKEDIIKYGLRNSLLVAPMPTASTSQILGNTEAFEPISSNIFSRSTLAGTFTLVNRYLVNDLTTLGLWNPEMKNRIIAEKGSIQDIDVIPQNIKNLYKTVWEISQKTILDMAADRGVFIDQSQSLNIHMKDPTFGKLSSMHFHGWKLGLKTGMYYLRSKAAVDAIQFTVDNEWKKSSLANLAYKPPPKEEEGQMCEMKDGCLSCGC